MITHIWSVLCNSSTIDQNTNNISLFNILERITTTISLPSGTKKLPPTIHIPINYQLVSYWFKEEQIEETAEVFINIITSNQNVIKKFSHSIKMSSDMKRLRTIINISGIDISTEDIYRFQISIKRPSQKPIIVASIPLEINIKKIYNPNTRAES